MIRCGYVPSIMVNWHFIAPFRQNATQTGCNLACVLLAHNRKAKKQNERKKRPVNSVCLLHRQHLLLFHFIGISLWGDFSGMENIDYDCDSSGLYKKFLRFFLWTQMLRFQTVHIFKVSNQMRRFVQISFEFGHSLTTISGYEQHTCVEFMHLPSFVLEFISVKDLIIFQLNIFAYHCVSHAE